MSTLDLFATPSAENEDGTASLAKPTEDAKSNGVQPSAVEPLVDSTGAQPSADGSAPQDWTQLHLSRLDRTYRYRVHLDRIQDLSAYDEMAPGSWRFELEFLDLRDGSWREVRFYPRRLEIWALIRDRIEPPSTAPHHG